MYFKKTLVTLILFCLAWPVFAQESTADLKKIIATQQAAIAKLQKNLEDAGAAAASARKVADEALIKANAAATAASNAQTSANVADTKAQNASNSAGRIYTVNTGGGRSCRATCDTGGGSCVASFAGVRPLETWSCEANPAGNLICLCINL